MKKIFTLFLMASLAFTIQAQDITNKLSATGDFKVNKSDDANIMTIKNDGKVGIGTDTPTSTLDVSGTLSLPIVVTSAATYTMGESDYTLVGNKTDGNLTVSLPTVSSTIHGRIYVIKRFGNQIDISSADHIDGLPTFSLDNAKEFVVIQAIFQGGTATWVAIGGKY